MFKIDNGAAKKFAIVYGVCWVISAITCAVVYFKWFAEARELQRRANKVINRDIVKECFDSSLDRKLAKYMPSGSEWDDLPDEELSAQERMLKAYHDEQNRIHDEDDDELY